MEEKRDKLEGGLMKNLQDLRTEAINCINGCKTDFQKSGTKRDQCTFCVSNLLDEAKKNINDRSLADKIQKGYKKIKNTLKKEKASSMRYKDLATEVRGVFEDDTPQGEKEQKEKTTSLEDSFTSTMRKVNAYNRIKKKVSSSLKENGITDPEENKHYAEKITSTIIRKAIENKE